MIELIEFEPFKWIQRTLETNKNAIFMYTDTSEFYYRDLMEEIINTYHSMKKDLKIRGKICIIEETDNLSSFAALISALALGCLVCPSIKKNTEKYQSLLMKIGQVAIYSEKNKIMELASANDTVELIETESYNGGLIFFTSGTTGLPKAVIHKLQPLFEKYTNWAPRKDTLIRFLGFDHMGGINTIFAQLATGASIARLNQISVVSVCSAIEKYKVNFLPTTPTFLKMMLISKVWEKYILDSLKTISYGAEAMNEELLAKLVQFFPNVQFKQTYGMTELGVLSVHSKSSSSTWLKLKLSPEQMKIVEGTLYLKVPTLAKLIIHFEKTTRVQKVDSSEWFNTQDKVEIDGEFLRFLGRESDVINVAGQKVYPLEIEKIVNMCPAVILSMVSGERNFLLGNTVVVQVVINQTSQEEVIREDILSLCRAHLPKFQVPTKIVFVEEIQMTERFKLNREKI